MVEKGKIFKSKLFARVAEERSKLVKTGALCRKISEAVGETSDVGTLPCARLRRLKKRRTKEIRLIEVSRRRRLQFSEYI